MQSVELVKALRTLFKGAITKERSVIQKTEIVPECYHDNVVSEGKEHFSRNIESPRFQSSSCVFN